MRVIPIVLVAIIAGASVLAQSNARGSATGTNAYAVRPIRTEPRVAWEVKTRYRDSSALTLVGRVLVTGNPNGTGGTYAYDADSGKVLWRVPSRIRGYPVVDANAAYAVNDVVAANRFRLSRLDLKTGKPLWSAPDQEDLGNHDAAPVIVGDALGLTSRNRAIGAYDLATGTRRWQHVMTTRAPRRFLQPMVSCTSAAGWLRLGTT